MMISTKGRYALRVLIDLAEHQGEGCIPMKDVAARQGISLKYLEKIMPLLAGRLVEGQKGKGGGYRLSRPPEECRVGEVLQHLRHGESGVLDRGAPAPLHDSRRQQRPDRDPRRQCQQRRDPDEDQRRHHTHAKSVRIG